KKGIFILDWKTAVKIPWDIVLLFGGGFAVASGFQVSKLASFIAKQLESLNGMPMIVFIAVVTLLVVFLTEITSNTATATLLVPIMGASAVALGIHPYATIVPACVAASFAFMLPVATPPNAVVFGSGAIRIKDMARAGLGLNIFGTVVIVIFVMYVMPMLWGIDLTTTPDWAKAAEAAAAVAK
ncbi:MAG: SLC13 family permease, partial [Candidatus Mucispirillum faecigallinarum]|nr:SLC13 family permease [Candidatus Mucispirillum faecigallinarum]